MTFKMMIAACCLGMALLLQTETGLGQAKVQDISQELWQKLPKDYGLFDCGFIPKPDAKNIWWGCKLYKGSAGRAKPNSAFVWVLPIDNSGNLGNGLLGSSWAGKGRSWFSVLAFGAKNNLLAMDVAAHSTVAALGLPSSSSKDAVKLSQLWQYSLPKTLNEMKDPLVIQATAVNDGGYALMAGNLKPVGNRWPTWLQDRFTIIRLTAEGKERWQYHYTRQLPASIKLEDGLPIHQGVKDFFLTSDQRTVMYGEIYQTSDVSGTFLICLDAAGKEISNQFFNHHRFIHLVERPDHGFWFIDYQGDTGFSSLGLLNKSCQKVADQPLNLPTHDLKGKVYNDITAIAIAPNHDLLIFYRQSDLKAAENHLPSMYLAQINQKGELVHDIGIITGQDNNRDYLGFYFGRVFKTTVTILPQTNEILVSIHNGFSLDTLIYSRDDIGLPQNDPILYRVKLP